MSPALWRRTIVKRDNIAERWGRQIVDWIDSRPPVSVFVIAVILGFLILLVVLACLWETIRKCRNSMRTSNDRARAEWVQLPDGSSVLTGGRVPSPTEQRRGDYRVGTVLGPMHSLIRDARQGGSTAGGVGTSGGGAARAGAYQGVETGATQEMIAESNFARYTAYDPPIVRQHFERVPSGSTGRWSGQTIIESAVPVEDKPAEAKVEPITLPVSHRPPPPIPAQMPSLVPSPHTVPPPPSNSISPVPVPVSSPPVRTAPSPGHRRQASSGVFQPMPLQLVNQTSAAPARSSQLVGGEERFSTPKPTPTPSTASGSMSSSISTSNVVNHLRHSIASVSTSSGWSVPTLTPSPVPGSNADDKDHDDKSYKASSIMPPRVDLQRTWSLSSWIPGLNANEKKEEEETMGLVQKAENEKE